MVVHIDSHGYSNQAGTHAVSLTVVMYALLLGGQHRKMPSNTILRPQAKAVPSTQPQTPVPW